MLTLEAAEQFGEKFWTEPWFLELFHATGVPTRVEFAPSELPRAGLVVPVWVELMIMAGMPPSFRATAIYWFQRANPEERTAALTVLGLSGADAFAAFCALRGVIDLPAEVLRKCRDETRPRTR